MIFLIAPYRDRPQQFKLFIEHYSLFLDLEKVKIIIFEQANSKPFNKGLLHNCGIKYLYKNNIVTDEDIVILNDIDCLINPHKIEFMLDSPEETFKQIFGYSKIWFNRFHCLGGIFSFKLKNFLKINGFPNDYWGWGAEDLALGYRAEKNNYIIDKSKIIDVSNTVDINRLSNPSSGKVRNRTNIINIAKLNSEIHKPFLSLINGINNCVFRLVDRYDYENYIHIKLDF